MTSSSSSLRTIAKRHPSMLFLGVLLPTCLLIITFFFVSAANNANANNNGFRRQQPPPRGPTIKNDPRNQEDPRIIERTGGKQGNIAPRYKRAMLAALDAESRLYTCRFANGTSQRILDLDCFFAAIHHFPYNATWYKQAAITAKVGGFVQKSFALWNSSLYTVLDARGMLSITNKNLMARSEASAAGSSDDEVKKKSLPEEEVFTPMFVLEMLQRQGPQDAIELAKVWVEVLVAQGKLDQANEIVDTFLLPDSWQDLSQDVVSVSEEDRSELLSGVSMKSNNKNDKINNIGDSSFSSRFENRSWAGQIEPTEAGEIYRSLLSPADAAAAQSFMLENAELVKKRTARARRRKERAAEKQQKTNGDSGDVDKKKTSSSSSKKSSSSSLSSKPLDNTETAGRSFTALLHEHIGMTAELLIRDTLQSTSQIKNSVRRIGRTEFEKTQRKRCGRAFYARSGGIVRWMNAIKYIEDCVLRWPHLHQWMQRDDESDMIVREYPGFHAIARAETHQFAALGTPKLLTLLLNMTGPEGGAIEDAMKQTPLHLAAGAGHKETISVIMAHGVSPTLEDIGKVQALYHLCRQPHLKKILEAGQFQLPKGAPHPSKVCSEKDVRKMLEEVAAEPRKEERADEIDDSGAGWMRTVKRKEEAPQTCDKRIEFRSINSINENDFAARYASGSEPLLIRSDTGLKSLQRFFSRTNLLERENMMNNNMKMTNKKKDDDGQGDSKNKKKKEQQQQQQQDGEIIKVRVEIVPEAEKYGSGLAQNKTISQFILGELASLREEYNANSKNKDFSKKLINSNNNVVDKPLFAVVDVTEEHPWGKVIFGSVMHQQAKNKNRARIRPHLPNQVAEEILSDEKKLQSKVNTRSSKALGKKKTPLHFFSSSSSSSSEEEHKKKLSRQDRQVYEHGELFRPPYSPKNRNSAKSLKQSFFVPVPTVSLRFASVGAISNLVVSMSGRIHAVIHGEQRIVMIPPAYAVTTRDPISIEDFEQNTNKAKDITEQYISLSTKKSKTSVEWDEKAVLHKCTLLAGDILFIPPYWSFGFESYNGESVSVMGRIAWR